MKLLVIFLIGFTSINLNPVFANCFFQKCTKKKEELNKVRQINYLVSSGIALNLESQEKTFRVDSIDFKEILKKDNINLEKSFGGLILSDSQIIQEKVESFDYEIESDSQYTENEIIYAEGNVLIFTPYGRFKADKISFNRESKIFKAYDNLLFEKGNQFLRANFLEYNFYSNSGSIHNVYGTVDFSTFQKDLKYKDNIFDNNQCGSEKNIDLVELPQEIELLDSSNSRFLNSLEQDSFKLDLDNVTRWRFKAEKINLKEESWSSEEIFFTNDPFNKPQFVVRSRGFNAEFINSKTKLKSKATTLNFDNKIHLPIGRRTIADDNAGLRWGIGYETNNKDGLYIMRNFDPIIFSQNFDLDLSPYFLIQRAISGSTNSFRAEGSTVISENIKNEISFADYFAINGRLKGKLLGFNLISNFDSKTLNPDKFYDSFSIDVDLLKSIYRSDSKNIKKENGFCRNKSFSENKLSRYSSDFGLYSRFDRDDIYFAYGAKLLNNYTFSSDKVFKDYSLILDVGQFKGKNNENNKLINLTRYGLNTNFSHTYKIINLSSESNIYGKDYKYIPKLIDQGIFLKPKISYGIYNYSNGKSQNIISLGLGHQLKFGNLKRSFLDYTELNVVPEFIIKNNQSPFTFDDFNDNSRISIDIKQHLVGPIIFGFKGNYNINTNSSEYGNIENKTYSLNLSRRSYSLNLSYLESNKAVFLGFQIFNFGDADFDKNNF